jgi:hypothetical protein
MANVLIKDLLSADEDFDLNMSTLLFLSGGHNYEGEGLFHWVLNGFRSRKRI